MEEKERQLKEELEKSQKSARKKGIRTVNEGAFRSSLR